MEMTIAKSNAFFVTATLVVGALALSACSNASRTLGLDPAPPDEFTVVSKAPLTIPPDFNLRPPKPGAARPQEQTPTTRAQAALLATLNLPRVHPPPQVRQRCCKLPERRMQIRTFARS